MTGSGAQRERRWELGATACLVSVGAALVLVCWVTNVELRLAGLRPCPHTHHLDNAVVGALLAAPDSGQYQRMRSLTVSGYTVMVVARHAVPRQALMYSAGGGACGLTPRLECRLEPGTMAGANLAEWRTAELGDGLE